MLRNDTGFEVFGCYRFAVRQIAEAPLLLIWSKQRQQTEHLPPQFHQPLAVISHITDIGSGCSPRRTRTTGSGTPFV